MPENLQVLPNSAVALVLGVCLGRRKRVPGQVATLTAELRRRGVYADMCAALDPELVRKMELMEAMDRGAAWNQGNRRPR